MIGVLIRRGNLDRGIEGRPREDKDDNHLQAKRGDSEENNPEDILILDFWSIEL